MNKKQIVSIVMTVALLMSCAPVTQPASTLAPTEAVESVPTSAPIASPDHIKVSVLSFLSYAPLFIAQEEGFFAAQNLEVEFVNIESTQENTTALLSGQIDVMVGFVTVGLLNAMGQDVNMRIVANKGYLEPDGCTSTALLARTSIVTDGELNLSAEQLKTAVALYGQGSIHEYFFDTMLSPLGFNTSENKSVQLPFNELGTAMQSASLDFAMIAEPWVTRIVNSGEAVILKDYKNDFPDAEYSTLVFGPSLLDQNTDAGNRFMVAYLQAVKQYQAGPTDRNIAIVNQYTKLDPAELKTLCWQPMRSDGMINTQTIVDFQNWAVAKGYLTQTLPVDAFWNPSFVEFAHSQLK